MDGDDLWRAALQLYAKTVELRHGIVHRRADITEEHELRVEDEGHPHKVHTLSAHERLAFCRVARRMLNAILAKSIDEHERADLTFQLASPGSS